jgi:hypothetical protein
MMIRLIAMFLFIFVIAWGPHSDVNAQAQPSATPMEFFGLILQRADQGTAWPSIRFGSWRLWDAYVNWQQLEPKRGEWDFSRLDRYVAMAKQHNVDLMLPLANSPQWAAARPNDPSGYKPGNSSEPANIEDWRRYVRTVGERYKGRIHNYQVWNEPNAKLFFTGSPAKLVELTCEAFKILKSIDPQNQIVSAGSTPGAKDHLGYLDNFLASGGKDCIDIVGHHFYVPHSGPEAMVPLIRGVRNVMKKNGVSEKPLWNTETGWWIANGDGTPDHPMVAKGGWKKISLEEAGDFVPRAFILARAEGVDRFFWYAWDSRYGLGMIEPTSGKPKPMVESWNNTVDRLVGSTRPVCSQTGKNWNCSFIRKNGTKDEISWSAK